MSEPTTKTNCRKCAGSTNHRVLFSTSQEGEYDFYEERHTWEVLQCLGCDTIGFRHTHVDMEEMVETPDGERPKTTYRRYPHSVAGHKLLDYLHMVPGLISKVYRESVAAYASDASIVAGMGLRATIEAVCNHLEISGNSLQKRIDQLHKGGHISSSDKKRLHAIRFLGNDAAHDIRQPKHRELAVALDIVEHLMKSVFILEQRAKELDTSIETYQDLVPVLKSSAGRVDETTSHTLTGLLGKNVRRLATDLATLESELVARIDAGEVKFLALDTVQEVEGKKVQFYKRIKDEFDELGEIPF